MIDVVAAVVVAAVAVVFDWCFCCIAPITTVVKRVFFVPSSSVVWSWF